MVNDRTARNDEFWENLLLSTDAADPSWRIMGGGDELYLLTKCHQSPLGGIRIPSKSKQEYVVRNIPSRGSSRKRDVHYALK